MQLSGELKARIDSIVGSDDVVLFMKGNRNFPQCGFSATVVQILNTMVSEYTTVNVLTEPEIRQAIKSYSDWPTIPQLYVRGEFVGGCDIVREMYESGELKQLFGGGEVEPPAITVTDSAKAALLEVMSEAEAGDAVHLSIDHTFQHALDLGPRTDRAVEVQSNGVTLLVEPMSAQRADGLTIDFVDGPGGTGFKMDNPNRPPEVTEISPADLKAKLDAGEIERIYDVRTPEERARAVIEGSVVLDDEAVADLERIDVKTPVVFYCHTGRRSQAAAEHFRDRGFKQVYNLTGGIDAWSVAVDPSVPRY